MSTDKTPNTTPAATSKTRNRTIDVNGMKGDDCVAKVTNSLKNVKDISVDEVKVGTVKLRAATREEVQAACTAIKEAGFEPHEAMVPANRDA